MKRKMWRMGKLAGCTIAGSISLLLSAAAVLPDNPASPEYQANIRKNRSRVEALMKEKQFAGDLVSYTVVPMSETMRLADVYPADGKINSPLMAVLAKDEFEPISFQLFALKNLKNVTFDIPDLKAADGSNAVLSSKNLDMKVVKIWYQNGNRWTSYFADVGLGLCPELLLKDENLIKVDTREVANYARVKTDKGEKYVWISAPNKMDPGVFDPMQKGFEDAKTLQPVTLNANEFKQFFITVHAPENQKSGLYSGVITVKSNNKELMKLPIYVNVLPYVLPLPKSFDDLDKPFVAAMMGGGSSMSDMMKHYGEPKLARQKLEEHYQNLKNHSLFYPGYPQEAYMFELIRKMGFPMDVVMGKNFVPWYGRNFGGRLTFDNYMTAKAASEKAHKFYMKHVGHNNILTSYGDEQGAAFVVAHRNFHKYFMQYGIQVGCAGHSVLFYKGGYAYGL